MNTPGNFLEVLRAIVVSSAAAVMAAVITLVLLIAVGDAMYHGEASYGVPLRLGPLLCPLAAGIAFVLVFRRVLKR